MDTNECLYRCFDEWVQLKEKEGYVKNVCGVNGLIAVISFIDYIKEKIDANNNIDRQSNQRDQTHYGRTRLEPRNLSKA
jgi:ribosomal 30S subunit maturation factor RimM